MAEEWKKINVFCSGTSWTCLLVNRKRMESAYRGLNICGAALKDFQKLSLRSGQKETVTFFLPKANMGFYDDAGRRLLPGSPAIE